MTRRSDLEEIEAMWGLGEATEPDPHLVDANAVTLHAWAVAVGKLHPDQLHDNPALLDGALCLSDALIALTESVIPRRRQPP